MSTPRKPEHLLVLFFLIMGVAIFGFIHAVEKDISRKRQQCQESNGDFVRVRDGTFCFRKGVLHPFKEAE